MNRLLSIAVIGLLLTGLLAGCEEESLHSPEDYSYIGYGASFGECLGYCAKSIEVKDSLLEFLKRGWNMDGRLPDIYFSRSITSMEWDSLVNKIDFDRFIKLDSIIGCPDCADGGAEWIEIKKYETVYKITFECGNEPESVKSYIDILRTYLNSFEIL